MTPTRPSRSCLDPSWFLAAASLKDAVRTWPHSDPVSWAQRTSSVSLLKRLDQNIVKAVAALRQSDPKYCRGPTKTATQSVELAGGGGGG